MPCRRCRIACNALSDWNWIGMGRRHEINRMGSCAIGRANKGEIVLIHYSSFQLLYYCLLFRQLNRAFCTIHIDMERTIQFDDVTMDYLKALAFDRRVSVASLVRDAVASYYGLGWDREIQSWSPNGRQSKQAKIDHQITAVLKGIK